MKTICTVLRCKAYLESLSALKPKDAVKKEEFHYSSIRIKPKRYSFLFGFCFIFIL
jgi:hypothetical protein